jgi:two-component SAPR family response regulator
MLQPTNNNKGITTNEIIEIMWPGVIKSKALNNRGYLFNKLRKTIEELDGCEIVLEDGYWNMSLSSKVYCDYLELQKLTKNTKEFSLQSLSSYYSYVKRGRFLNGIEYSWLDNIKGRIANEIVDILFQYTDILKENNQQSLLQEVAQRILSADDMNERALYMEISMFINQGKRNLAKYSFDCFCVNYEKFYGEAYPYDFDRFLRLSDEGPDRFT